MVNITVFNFRRYFGDELRHNIIFQEREEIQDWLLNETGMDKATAYSISESDEYYHLDSFGIHYEVEEMSLEDLIDDFNGLITLE